MKIYQKDNGGFTLIELLVVISIISLLSSVILSNLNAARNRAKDAKIKQEVAQFTNLLALNYSTYGSYCQLQSYWIPYQVASCAAAFSSSYAYGTQAQRVCQSILASSPDIDVGWGVGQLKIYANTAVAGQDCTTNYSIMVYLNTGNWYCSGSSGRKGEYASYENPGCYSQP